MGKYTQASEVVYAVFGTPQWDAEGIPAFPTGFQQPEGTKKFVRVSIVAASQNTAVFPNSVSGAIIVHVFVQYGRGNGEALAIADTLDKYLAGKSISNQGHLQTGTSTFVEIGQDKANPALLMSKYTVPFNFYGVN